MLELYYETEAIRVSYDEELQLGVGEWKGLVGSDEIRATALRSLEFMNEQGVTRWLADQRKLGTVPQQDQQWVMEEFIPKLLESPLRRMAMVVSEDNSNKMAMEQILKRSGGLGNISLQSFDNVADAMLWLESPFEEEKAPESRPLL